MLRRVLRSKIHRANVTHADVAYEGSITLSPELIESAMLTQFEAVWVWNVTNASRFETYVIEGELGSTDIAINGAAAHLVTPGDVIIIAAFNYMADAELVDYKPRLVFVDSNNRVAEIRPEIPGPRVAHTRASL